MGRHNWAGVVLGFIAITAVAVLVIVFIVFLVLVHGLSNNTATF